jgi:hypothetical protein
MRLQILMAASVKVTALWGIVPCSLGVVYQYFRGTCCLYRQSDSPNDGGCAAQMAVTFKILDLYILYENSYSIINYGILESYNV